MRALIRWGRSDAAVWLSHLDIQRAIQRALRRSGVSCAWSQGFNPHVLLSFASALPVGVASRYEVMDITFAQAPETPAAQREAFERIAAALPPGFFALESRWVDDRFPSPMALAWAEELFVEPASDAPAMVQACATLMAAASLTATIRSKKGERRVDIRPLILSLEPQASGIVMRLRHGSSGSVRFESVWSALCGIAGVSPRPQGLVRTALFDDAMLPLLQTRPSDPAEAEAHA